MANLYYNLSLTSGGTGTTGDPYGLAEWVTKTSSSHSDMLYVKGEGTLPHSGDYYIYGLISGWYSDQPNGVDAPWIMEYTYFDESYPYIYLGSGCIACGGYISTPSTIWMLPFSSVKTMFLAGDTIVIHPSPSGNPTLVQGSTLRAIADYGYLFVHYNEQNTENPSSALFTDCLIQVPEIDVMNGTMISGIDYTVFTKCAFEPSGIINYNGTYDSNPEVYDCQFSWAWTTRTPEPILPPTPNYHPADFNPNYPDITENVQYYDPSVALAGIDETVKVGTPPYIGYNFDLFNQPRMTIGAIYNIVTEAAAVITRRVKFVIKAIPTMEHSLRGIAEYLKIISPLNKKKGKQWIY